MRREEAAVAPVSRGGRAKTRETPERRCIVTGESGPKAGLVRFVVDPEGTVVPDVAEKLPGHGIWVSADRAALEKAAAKRLFARAARRSVEVPADLADRVAAALAARVVERVSLARKAGAAVAGFEKTKEWLENGTAGVLMQACDGAARGKAKLRPPEGAASYVGALTAAELGLAFGRESVIHAALARGGLAARGVEDAARLSGVRKIDGAAAAGVNGGGSPGKGVETT